MIPSLDGLRALSIILVVLAHAIPDEKHSYLFRLLFLHSGLGVSIFFVISGFLITTLLLREREEFGVVSLRLFYFRRAIRILPAYGIYVVTVLALTLLGLLRVPSRLWLFVLTYTVNFTPTVWVVGHLWSLSVEEQFYLLWPLALRWCRRRGFVLLAIFTLIADPVLRSVELLTGTDLRITNQLFATPHVCGPIGAGCLLACYFARVRSLCEKYRWFPALTAIGFFLCILLDSIDLGASSHQVVAFSTMVQVRANLALSPVLIAAIVKVVTNLLLGLSVARFVLLSNTWSGRLLNSNPAVFLGKLSY